MKYVYPITQPCFENKFPTSWTTYCGPKTPEKQTHTYPKKQSHNCSQEDFLIYGPYGVHNPLVRCRSYIRDSKKKYIYGAITRKIRQSVRF